MVRHRRRKTECPFGGKASTALQKEGMVWVLAFSSPSLFLARSLTFSRSLFSLPLSRSLPLSLSLSLAPSLPLSLAAARRVYQSTLKGLFCDAFPLVDMSCPGLLGPLSALVLATRSSRPVVHWSTGPPVLLVLCRSCSKECRSFNTHIDMNPVQSHHASVYGGFQTSAERLGGPGKGRLRVIEDPAGLLELKAGSNCYSHC